MDYSDAILYLKEHEIKKEDGTYYEFGEVQWLFVSVQNKNEEEGQMINQATVITSYQQCCSYVYLFNLTGYPRNAREENDGSNKWSNLFIIIIIIMIIIVCICLPINVALRIYTSSQRQSTCQE